MRVETVEVDTEEEAHALCPWAFVCAMTSVGFKCFESEDEYLTWVME